MGYCTDHAISYFHYLGYHVVRYPSNDIRPLALIGQCPGDGPAMLGPLDILMTNSSRALPVITADVAAVDVNGQASSKVEMGIGANILGTLIQALGGHLRTAWNCVNAEKVQFIFSDVLGDSVLPVEVDNYLRGGRVESLNPVLQQYILGNGNLYLITKTVKSRKVTVRFERNDGTGVTVNIPMIQEMVGGDLVVTAHAKQPWVVTFQGKTNLSFGFQCFPVAIDDGVLALTADKGGGIHLAVGQPRGIGKPVLLGDTGLLELSRR